MSFQEGTSTLIRALQERLTGGEIRLNTPVLRVHEHGVTLAGGEELRGRAVINTTPPGTRAPCTSGTTRKPPA